MTSNNKLIDKNNNVDTQKVTTTKMPILFYLQTKIKINCQRHYKNNKRKIIISIHYCMSHIEKRVHIWWLGFELNCK